MYSPKYSISNTILKNIGVVEASREVIENAPLVPSFEKQFQTEARTKTVHHGTHIEGNDLTLVQTRKIMEGGQVYGKPRDIQEVINYRNAMDLLDDLAFKRGEYSKEMLLDIHRCTVEKIVSDDKVGVLRNTQVVIKEEGTGNVILKPPPFIEIPYLIDDFLSWLTSNNAKEIHPVLRSGITHYTLVAIHPFVEGNGRAVRAFTQLILMKEGYNIKKLFSLEEHFDNDLGAYYDALFKVDEQAPNIADRDLTPWLEYFTQTVAVELSKVKEKVRKLSLDTRMKTKFGEQITLSDRQMRLMEYISDQTSAPMSDLKNVIDMVSEDTILRDLTDLIKKGIIKKEGSTKATRYVIQGK
ncbi:Fic family protein [Candidatus Microgenomates bacterium]|nr:Fic family protein [Candidatus Microgenomates bacterium]